uniref:NADPH oxidase Respiratory burst domain-containing protein n=1 Tax=Aegilops tauschii subsp. strangulata TaxID=200361 RepID=A0A453FVL2_AEGTS
RQFASRVSMKVPEVVPGIRPGGGRMTRMQSSAQMGLKGLRFLDKTSGSKEGWKAVERRFDEMSKASGRLPKESFGKCIGEHPCIDCVLLIFLCSLKQNRKLIMFDDGEIKNGSS